MEDIKSTNLTVTPMMAQYIRIKSQYPDALLFYRMGDFYELFFEDAEIASEELNITLTKRGQHNGKAIAMCGVPHHASQNYLLNLIRKGHKVAICEQTETPEDAKKRGYKAVVNRAVVRLVTPGTLTEDGLLDKQHNNFLLSYYEKNKIGSASWIDLSTGDFFVTNVDKNRLYDLLIRIEPVEILVPQTLSETLLSKIFTFQNILSTRPPENFNSCQVYQTLKDKYGITLNLDSSELSSSALCSIAGILEYLNRTQCGNLPLLKKPILETNETYLEIDSATRQSLELTKTLAGDRSGSLLSTINKTVTSGGARLLSKRLASPLKNIEEINARLENITYFSTATGTTNKVLSTLKGTPDIERSISRLGLTRGSPRDLGIIRNCLRVASEIKEILDSTSIPQQVVSLAESLSGFEALKKTLESALVENPNSLLKDGEFIAENYNKALDEARELRKNSKNILLSLQAEYLKLVGVNSLKIKFNNILGYFIEVPIKHKDKLVDHILSTTFILRQSTSNTARFSTVELSEISEKVATAESDVKQLEEKIYFDLVSLILNNLKPLSNMSKSLAELDVITSLTELARSRDWVRPLIDGSTSFNIQHGKHPVVEMALSKNGNNNFVSNNCNLDPESSRILLITGPNMAGKSTYMRQNALITVLAQMGSFVPAKFAHIGVVGQIFSRVGAADDLTKGRSTFMVEMIETANILKNAKPDALVIMDEIGRGTATYDGLSIAWATLEHLHNVNKCRTLFATHYNELTKLNSSLPYLQNAKVSVSEWNGDVVFLHEVKPGIADKSYGVQVAKLAGVPDSVTVRAKSLLKKQELFNANKTKYSLVMNEVQKQKKAAPLSENNESEKLKQEAISELSSIDVNNITPNQALNILHQICAKLSK